MKGQIASLAAVASLSGSVAMVRASRCVRAASLLGGLSAASAERSARRVKAFGQTASGFVELASAEACRAGAARRA